MHYCNFSKALLASAKPWHLGSSKKPKVKWRTPWRLKYVSYAYEAGEKWKVDPLLLLAIMKPESNYRQSACNKSGASGLMQVIPKWHREDQGKEKHLQSQDQYRCRCSDTERVSEFLKATTYIKPSIVIVVALVRAQDQNPQHHHALVFGTSRRRLYGFLTMSVRERRSCCVQSCPFVVEVMP